VALAGLVLLSLASGIAHATGVVRAVGAFTMMQVHVATAVGAIPFAVWHIVARPAKPRRTDLSRRTLLRSGVVAAGSLAAFGSVSAVTAATGLPGRRTRFTGSYPVAGEDYPVTQWLSDGIADVDPATWRLTVSSEGRELRTWSLVELNRVAEPIEGVLDCTGGWFVDETWRAVRLDRVLEAVEGRSVRAVSATGYSRRFPLADAGRLWVATGTGKAALSAGHGAPARIVAPGRRGFWWVKWLVELDVGATPWWWQPPFPLQ
jgi:DMSO/TMAO reductase YedYZ molybdopterin-dependent catalytic subunit